VLRNPLEVQAAFRQKPATERLQLHGDRSAPGCGLSRYRIEDLAANGELFDNPASV
jgi:hypothetical protein